MSITKEDVQKMAQMAKIEVTEAEIDGFVGDFEKILAYVDQLRQVDIPDGVEPTYIQTNMVRDDENPHDSGAYTADLLDAAPASKDNYVKVPKIL